MLSNSTLLVEDVSKFCFHPDHIKSKDKIITFRRSGELENILVSFGFFLQGEENGYYSYERKVDKISKGKIFNFHEVDIYSLSNLTNLERMENLDKIEKEYGVKINRCKAMFKKETGKFINGSIGMSSIIMEHICKYPEFKPFVIFEDDVSVLSTDNFHFSYPEDSDLVMIGISVCFVHPFLDTDIRQLRVEEVEGFPHLLRDKGMLSCHGLFFPSLRFALETVRMFMNNCINKGIPWDIVFARLKQKYNTYTLRKPIVYQDKKVGGCEEETKIIL